MRPMATMTSPGRMVGITAPPARGRSYSPVSIASLMRVCKVARPAVSASTRFTFCM